MACRICISRIKAPPPAARSGYPAHPQRHLVPRTRSAHTRRMDHAIAQALADGYIAYSTTGDTSVLGMFSPDFYDNVSKTHGLAIFDVVSGWLDESFVGRSADLHLVTHTDDTVMIWYTAHGRHVGNGGNSQDLWMSWCSSRSGWLLRIVGLPRVEELFGV
jgi:hypothetical protein